MRTLEPQTWELARVVCLYYRRGMPQGEIAKQIGKSIMTVSRMLKEARKRGIVEFRLNMLHPTNSKMEQELKEQFPNVEEFIVLDNELLEERRFKTSLGRAAASYFSFLLEEDMTVGIGGGETVSGLVNALGDGIGVKGLVVVQLSGMTAEAASLGNEAFITQQLCIKLDAEGYFCPFPSPFDTGNLGGNTDLIESMCEKTQFRWKNVDVGLVGIGHVGELVGTSRIGYITTRDFNKLRKKNAVGDILLHFFDTNGQIVDEGFDRTVMSISWEQLKNVRKLVAVAGGTCKADAILAALKSGLIDTLITDCDAAVGVLRCASHTKSSEDAACHGDKIGV
jgi:DNA-binding transcriptional regulator LsrR (DeoR family)